ncbi:MAG: methionine--tRNA ligase [Elusimicrobiota bacterium]
MKKFYITTPIYYVNDEPHIGHTYTTVAADILARWHRLLGERVFFLTGTDEHGMKIFQAAQNASQDTQKYCNEIVVHFKSAWEKMNISYDRFIRTTEKSHISSVKKVLSELHRKDELYFSSYEGLYCIGCEKFLTETDLIDGMCPDHRVKPVVHKEGNYFFKLSGYREKLINAIQNEDDPNHFEILPQGRRNEIIGKLKTGLEDISISRANLPWGILLPFDSKQTTYVWVDALINYISGINYEEDETNFKFWWPTDVHLMAKDILWFHSVIWPAILIAVGLAVPKKIFAHGYFTISGQKMSKSLGNIISPRELIDEFGEDAARFLLMGAFPFGVDGDVTLKNFKLMYNARLANNVGNLVSRVFNMVEKYLGGRIEKPAGWSDEVFKQTRLAVEEIYKKFDELLIDASQEKIIELSDFGNRYIDRQEPWNLSKKTEDTEKLKLVLYNSLMMIKELAAYLYPFIPKTSEKIWFILGEKGKMDEVISSPQEPHFLTGTSLVKPSPLFPRK